MLRLQRGGIYHRFFCDTTPPKNKFFVVMGVEKDIVIGYFFINSNMNSYANMDVERVKLQIPIYPSDYSFLSYQSFISAIELHYFNKSALEAEIQEGKAQYKGRLTERDLNLLVGAVLKSDLYTNKQKEFFL